MKNKYMTLLSVLVIGATPLVASADAIDNEINNTETKIETLKGQKAAAEAALAMLNAEVTELENQVQSTLDQKVELEKEMNKLNEEIRKLEQAIEKRSDKIDDQARAAQVNKADRFLDVMLDADSISDAINRSWAYGKLVSANNDIVTAQKEDKEAVAKTKATVDKKLIEVNALTEQLKVQQEEMVAKQYDQAILTKEVEASLATEETKKTGLLAEKKAAEKRKAEAARIQKEEAAKAAAAAAKLQEEARKSEEAIAKEIENINTQEMPDEDTSKPAEDTNTNDDSSNNSNSGNAGNSGNSNAGNKPQTGSGDFKWPLPSMSITSGYGNRPDPNGVSGNGHDGIDLAGANNSNVYASRDGIVVSSSYNPSGGNLVILQHDNGYYSYYLHLNSQSVTAGQEVRAGEVVGLMGSTGNSTGTHLHFGISTGMWSGFVDPGVMLGLY